MPPQKLVTENCNRIVTQLLPFVKPFPPIFSGKFFRNYEDRRAGRSSGKQLYFGVPPLGGQIGGTVAVDFGESAAPDHQHKEEKMEQGGDGPGDGVGHIKAGGGVVDGEYGGHPQQPQAAGAHNGGDHGNDRAAQSPQHAHQGVHDAANEIGAADIFHPYQGLDNYVGFAGGINAGQRCAEQIGQVATDDSKESRKQDAQSGHPVYPVTLGSAVVLAHEGNSGLVKGVHGDIDKALDVGASGGARHQNRVVEGVEGGLNDYVGQGEHHALEPGGQPHL